MKTRIKKIIEIVQDLVSEDNTKEALQILQTELPSGEMYAQYIKQAKDMQAEYFQGEKKYRHGLYKNRYYLNEMHDRILRLLEELKYFTKKASVHCKTELEDLRKKLYLSRSLKDLKGLESEAKQLTDKYPKEYEVYEFYNRVRSILKRESEKNEKTSSPFKKRKRVKPSFWTTLFQFLILYFMVSMIYLIVRGIGIA